jgi:hypothetical protein
MIALMPDGLAISEIRLRAKDLRPVLIVIPSVGRARSEIPLGRVARLPDESVPLPKLPVIQTAGGPDELPE